MGAAVGGMLLRFHKAPAPQALEDGALDASIVVLHDSFAGVAKDGVGDDGGVTFASRAGALASVVVLTATCGRVGCSCCWADFGEAPGAATDRRVGDASGDGALGDGGTGRLTLGASTCTGGGTGRAGACCVGAAGSGCGGGVGRGGGGGWCWVCANGSVALGVDTLLGAVLLPAALALRNSSSYTKAAERSERAIRDQ
jgi:hypothetical protein